MTYATAAEATDRPIGRCTKAMLALNHAETYGAALDAWEDFLVYWQRAVNRCEAFAEPTRGRGWLRAIIFADPALAYVRVARNTDDHGLLPVVEHRGAGSKVEFAFPIGDGISITADGRVGQEVAGMHAVIFRPEGLRLLPVDDPTAGIVRHPPPGMIEPMALAQRALAFINSTIGDVDGINY